MEFIDMRSVIHQKVEQLFSVSNLWASIMPVKIFGDLVSFVGHHQNISPSISVQLEKNDPMMKYSKNTVSALTSLNHSFDSIKNS